MRETPFPPELKGESIERLHCILLILTQHCFFSNCSIFIQFPSGATSCVALATATLSDTPLPWCQSHPYVNLLSVYDPQTLLFHHLILTNSSLPPLLAATRPLLDGSRLAAALVGVAFLGTEEGPMAKVLRVAVSSEEDEDVEFYLLNGNATIVASLVSVCV